MLENMIMLNWWVATGVLVLEIALLGKLFSFIVLSLSTSPNLSLQRRGIVQKFQENFKEIIFGTEQKIFQKFNLNILSEKFLLFFIFIFSLSASVMTLIYSEIFLQIPCALCWFERIFMYGIVLLSGISLFRPHLASLYKGEEYNAISRKFQLKNILIFSILGAIISLYHHTLQMAATFGSHLPCPSGGADCAKRLIFEYGHITFPWMAFILFIFFIVIILLQRKLKSPIL